MENPNLFPLPYDGSAVHDESWAKGFALEGKKVRVIDRTGRVVVGEVRRAQVSSDITRRFYGVGFSLRCGSEHFPYDVPVSADLKSIELVDAH